MVKPKFKMIDGMWRVASPDGFGCLLGTDVKGLYERWLRVYNHQLSRFNKVME